MIVITQSIFKRRNYIWCFPSRLKFKVNEISIGTKSLFNTDWSPSRLYAGMRGGFRPHFRIGSSWYRIYCLASAKFLLLYLFNGHQSFNTWSPWYALRFSLNLVGGAVNQSAEQCRFFQTNSYIDFGFSLTMQTTPHGAYVFSPLKLFAWLDFVATSIQGGFLRFHKNIDSLDIIDHRSWT